MYDDMYGNMHDGDICDDMHGDRDDYDMCKDMCGDMHNNGA